MSAGNTGWAGFDPDIEPVVISHGTVLGSSRMLVDNDLTADRTQFRVEYGFEPATD